MLTLRLFFEIALHFLEIHFCNDYNIILRGFVIITPVTQLLDVSFILKVLGEQRSLASFANIFNDSNLTYFLHIHASKDKCTSILFTLF